MGRIWAICSGSGGVGKTMLALSLAAGAAQRGKTVVLLDASGISRSCDLALGLESVMTLDMNDVLTQQTEIKSALYPLRGYPNLRLANASLYAGVALSELSGVIMALQSMCDILIIDTPTGQLVSGDGVMTRDDEWIFVTRPDDASMRAVERLLQMTQGQEANRSLVLNLCRRERIKRGLQHTADTVTMVLDCAVLGAIPEDERLALCSVKGKTAIESDGPAKHVLREILSRLLG